MYVHAAARFAVDGLGHQRCRQTVFAGDIVNDVLDVHRAVRHRGHLAEQRLNFELGVADLGVMVFDGDAGLFDLHAHLAARLVRLVEGLGNVIVVLIRSDAAGAFGIAVPVGLFGVDVETDVVVRDLPLDLVEQVKLKLGQDHHGVGNAAVAHVLLSREHDVARILRQRTVGRIVNDHGVADHAERLDLAERVDHRGLKVGNIDHVALFDHGVTVVGSVKADAARHRFLGEIRGGDSDVTELTADVNDLEVDHFDVFLLNALHNVLCGNSHIAIPPER